MNIIKSIINMYKGNNSFAVHSALFALSGIAAVSFVNVISIFFGNSIYSVFSRPNDIVAAVFLIILCMIFIFLFGYKFKFTNHVIQTEDFELPAVSLDCYRNFVVILPLCIVWGLYLFALFWGFIITFGGYSELANFIFFLAIIVLIPFVQLILIMLSKDFKYKKYFFNPLFIFSLIKKSLWKTLGVVIQFLILLFVFSYVFKFLLFFILSIVKARVYVMIAILLMTCISCYIQEIFALAYLGSLADIVKEKMPKLF